MFTIYNLVCSDLLIYSVIIDVVMYWFLYQQKSRQSHSTKLFRRFILSVAAAGFFEILSWLVIVPESSALIPLSYLSNLLFFSVNLLPASLGLLYLDYIIFQSTERSKKRFFIYLIPVYVNVAFVIYNMFFDGFLFRIDSANEYHRGIAAYIGNGITLLVALVVVIGFFTNKQMINGRLTQTILVLTLLPVLGVVLQMLFYGLSLGIPAYTLAIFISFLLMERHELQKDPLTLLHSRAQMENRLRFKLKAQEPFTVIMIDVNGFKGINDQFGHNTGDQVLKDVSRILLSKSNYEDFVCRYGGDEFFVILESAKDIGQAYIKRIDQTLKEYSVHTPYAAGLSYGAVYVDKPEKYEVDELVLLTDKLMYEDKTIRRQKKQDHVM